MLTIDPRLCQKMVSALKLSIIIFHLKKSFEISNHTNNLFLIMDVILYKLHMSI